MASFEGDRGENEMNLTEKLKNYIKNDCDMDLVGVAPTQALDGEPEGHRPGDLLPGAKSVIVFGRALADGVTQAGFRTLEEKKIVAQSAYAAYGHDLAPNFLLVNDAYNIAQYLEDMFGAIAAPVPFGVQQSTVWDNVPAPIFTDPYRQGMPLDVFKAAMAAGIGEFGWSNRFLTREYGPRQLLCAVITTMELEYDEPYAGPKLCDPETCGVCVKLCPTCAIPAPGSGRAAVKAAGGREVEVAELKVNSCVVASTAYRKEFQGRVPVPDLIQGNDPTDEELREAFAQKPISGLSVDHYPRYLCERCLLYCPVGQWKERFFDTGLSKFDPQVRSFME